MTIDYSKYGFTEAYMRAKPRGWSIRSWAIRGASPEFNARYKRAGAPKSHGNDPLVKLFLYDTDYRRPEVQAIYGKTSDKSIWSTYLMWPVAKAFRKPVQNFYTQYPYTQFFINRGLAGKRHGGLDLPTPMTTPLVAEGKGKVLHAGPYGGYGIAVIIQVGKYWILHGHMLEPRVKVGQKVSRGQILGLSGNSGFSTGPHVHLEIRVKGVAIDPLPLLR